MMMEEEEEEEEEETTFCSNCRKDVTISNYPIHEIHCRRFIELCPLCDEPVPTAELKAHTDTEHRQVRCSLCHISMEHHQLEAHQVEDCLERLLSCQFCELETPCRTLSEHEGTCGTRTERCPDCQKYVMYKDQKTHGKMCPRTRSSGQGEASEIPCEFCTKTFPEEQLLQHQNTCGPLPQMMGKLCSYLHQDLLFSRPSSSRSHPYTAHFPHPQLPPRLPAPLLSSPSGSDSGSEDFDEISSCSVCACALPSEILQQHEEKCRFYDWQRKMGVKQNPMNDNKNL